MITIITKTYCPYSHAAIDILEGLKIDYINIDILNNQSKFEEIQKITKMRTVPQVFIGDINGKFLGGYTELDALYKSGELEKLLN